MKSILLSLFVLTTFSLAAQNQPAIPMYGESITLEKAKKLAAAAEAFAVGKQWPIAVAIVDTGGNLVILHTMDNTQRGSIDIAIGKARTANNFKRPTKSFEDAIAGGGAALRLLNVPGILPVEGGDPIFVDGKIVGAIGVSGMSAAQDSEVVKAALVASK